MYISDKLKNKNIVYKLDEKMANNMLNKQIEQKEQKDAIQINQEISKIINMCIRVITRDRSVLCSELDSIGIKDIEHAITLISKLQDDLYNSKEPIQNDLYKILLSNNMSCNLQEILQNKKYSNSKNRKSFLIF